MRAGFTLIEAMVSIAVFAILAVVASTLLLGVLRGTLKAAALNQVRSEGAYAVETMAKSIRFASSVSRCDGSGIQFKPRANDIVETIYSCTGGGGYIASNGARLTSPKVQVTSCSFECAGDEVNISLTLQPQKGGAVGLEGAQISIDSTTVTRNIADIANSITIFNPPNDGSRPSLCQSASISSGIISPGGSVTITGTAKTNDVYKFSYAFYNKDNINVVPQPIQFTSGTNYAVSHTVAPTSTDNLTVNYADINRPDYNWGGQLPTNFQVNVYFTNPQGFSLPEPACVVSFAKG